MPESEAPEQSEAGTSLQREYERRKAAREKRVRERFPRAGGFLLAITPEAQTTQAFAKGAEGERLVARMLEEKCPDVLFLHNRQRGSRARDGDIDHIAVAPSGVHVIDAKHYEGAKVDVIREGGLFSERGEILKVRGRDRTNLGRRGTRKTLQQTGRLDAARREEIWRHLATVLPPAT